MNNPLEVLHSARGQITPELIVWGLFFGFAIALVLALFSKRYMGKFVHTLLSQKITSPDKAKTLAELGYGKNPFVRMALVGKSAYSGLIFEKNEEVVYNGDSVVPAIRRKVDFESARFYIPSLLVARAEIRYDKKGTHVMAMAVGIVAFLVFAIVVISFLPTITELIREIL